MPTKPRKPSTVTDNGTIDHDLVKAMAHPLRYELLMRLGGRIASPNELSKEVDASLGAVSYHIRLLEQLGMVELVDRKQRRGAIEHFYRATQRAWFSKEGWAKIPGALRKSIAGATLRSVAQTVTDAAEGQAFEDPAVHVSLTPLTLDDEGYEQVCAVLDKALSDVLDIQSEALGRGAADRSTAMVMMHFDTAA